MDPSRALVPQIYTLTTVQVVIGLVWLTGLTFLVAASGTALLTPTWRAIMHKQAGMSLSRSGREA